MSYIFLVLESLPETMNRVRLRTIANTLPLTTASLLYVIVISLLISETNAQFDCSNAPGERKNYTLFIFLVPHIFCKITQNL